MAPLASVPSKASAALCGPRLASAPAPALAPARPAASRVARLAPSSARAAPSPSRRPGGRGSLAARSVRPSRVGAAASTAVPDVESSLSAEASLSAAAEARRRELAAEARDPRLAALRASLEALRAAPDDAARAACLLKASRAVPREEEGEAGATPLGASPLPLRSPEHLVAGCTARAWVRVSAGGAAPSSASPLGVVSVDSDSDLTRGAALLLAYGLRGRTLDELASLEPRETLRALGVPERLAGGGAPSPSVSRHASALNVLEAVRARARAARGDAPSPFPSLVVGRRGTEARGAYAAAQRAFLDPDAGRAARLAAALRAASMGVVAHFYMDPEVQGLLAAAKADWPHVAVSDSLVMADRAVAMARAGCTSIAVLGVDFMAENVRAILDERGFARVRVVRADPAAIGCTLAEAADAPGYADWLRAEADAARARGENPIHIVYINTSLRTKAKADAIVPTITCTSSNVVATVLSAFAQIPSCRVLYGPDSHMGANVAALLESISGGTRNREADPERAGEARRRDPPSPSVAALDAAARALHPAHTAASAASALAHFTYFENGACAVHEMFSAGVARRVRDAYGDALLTAHFEVPGEMFELALEASRRGAGVVGSTQNILDFVLAALREALARPGPSTVRAVLGTETGMVTSLVRGVRDELERAGRDDVLFELIFPVDDHAVAGVDPAEAQAAGLDAALVPGAAVGEGCSIHGGCASCPYMKMNTLHGLERAALEVAMVDAANSSVSSGAASPAASLRLDLPAGVPPMPVRDASAAVAAAAARLARLAPQTFSDETVGGMSIAAAGCVPILHMRDFQKGAELSQRLVDEVVARGSGKNAEAHA